MSDAKAERGRVSETSLRELVDERAIRQVILRYCRGIDRLDRELVRSCYHPGAVDRHGSFRGDVDAFLDWVWRLLEHYDSTMHFVGNLLVEFASPELARAETYGIAFHRGDPSEPKRNLVTGFRYIDRFEFRDGEWRIAQRDATTEWIRVDVPENWWPIGDNLLRGARDRSDSVFAPLVADDA